MKVILAEKPSVAREIAGFVGARSRRDSYLEGGGYQVTWAFGHLVALKEPEDYDPALKRWSLETLPLAIVLGAVPDVDIPGIGAGDLGDELLSNEHYRSSENSNENKNS